LDPPRCRKQPIIAASFLRKDDFEEKGRVATPVFVYRVAKPFDIGAEQRDYRADGFIEFVSL